jgi:transposase InsO family protein
MVDLTDVKGLFSLVTFKIAVAFDVFSRMPLSARILSKEPSAGDMASFISRTAKRHGRPAHFVSDRGRSFTGHIFRRALERLGVRPRFGAIGKKGSIALIERLRPYRFLQDPYDLLFRCPFAFHLSSPSLSLWRTHILCGSVFGGKVERVHGHRANMGLQKERA